MKGVITITKEDYLIYILYEASKSKEIKKNRVKSWIFWAGGLLIIAGIFYQTNEPYLALCFFVLGLYYAITYPFSIRRYNRKKYEKHIVESMKGCFDIATSFELTKDQIFTSNATSEMKIKTSELSRISEIGDFFFLKIKLGYSFILPKINFDYQELSSMLAGIALEYNIAIDKELNWKSK